VTDGALLAIASAAAAGLVGVGRPGWARSRLRRVLPGAGRTVRPVGTVRLPPEVRRWSAQAALVGVALLLLAGHGGLALPAALAAAVLVIPARREAARQAREAARLRRDLPRAADLLAMCLAAGAAPGDAVRRVGDVMDGPVREALRPIGAALRAGVDPAAVWSGDRPGLPGAGQPDEPLRRLGRAFSRAVATGAPLAETVSAVADEERERVRWAAEAAARRAGVRAVGPLALCFLPAFVLLGVVPVVVGVATDVLGGLR
jgi:Flp pilus assembly protein TadB